MSSQSATSERPAVSGEASAWEQPQPKPERAVGRHAVDLHRAEVPGWARRLLVRDTCGLRIEAVVERPGRRVDHAVEAHELVHVDLSHYSSSCLRRSRICVTASQTRNATTGRKYAIEVSQWPAWAIWKVMSSLTTVARVR